MKNRLGFLVLLISIFFSLNSNAEKNGEIRHFNGKMPDSLEQAKQLFSEYNGKLATILNQGNLTMAELVKIHELTYTLENSLGKMQSELKTLAEILERLHKASETAQVKETERLANDYLKHLK